MQSTPTQLLRANAEKNPGALSLCLPDPDGGLPVLTVSAFWSPDRLRLLFSSRTRGKPGAFLRKPGAFPHACPASDVPGASGAGNRHSDR